MEEMTDTPYAEHYETLFKHEAEANENWRLSNEHKLKILTMHLEQCREAVDLTAQRDPK